ncbi:MAG TPA: EAL domain-containing protein [Gammaproteobacteria bacterium]|nr:EAL domain-containing protein [Gammaproteobacteria bacterium]
MNESSVPVVILTERSEDVAYFNKTMRDAGHPVRCRGITKLDQLETLLDADPPNLLIFFAEHHTASVREVAKLRQLYARMSPLIAVRSTADEAAITEALQAGACDLVSTANPERICIVCERELRGFHLERALNDTLRSATQYKKQLKTFMSGSTDAIAQVQEGIVVDANQAWADLFVDSKIDDALGPIMDFLAGSSQATLKGALIACDKGRWDGDSLRVEALAGDGKTVTVELELEPSTFDGEPATRLSVRHRPAPEAEAQSEAIVEKVLNTDPVTGFLQRQQFLQILTDKLDQRAASGARALAIIRPDKFSEVERDVGPISSEEIIAQLAGILGRLMSESDVAGRFGGTVFAFVLERGSLRDIQAWAENALHRISEHLFEAAGRSLSLTSSIGLAEMGESSDRVEDLIRSAERANQHSRQNGGNQVIIEETADESTRIRRIDALWVRQIKSALVENRFRLVHLSIANLGGAAERMFDTVVRMVDEQGDEIGASDFMATAARNKLLRPIDRWVIDASFSFCAREASDLVFVKLSHESILDPSLVDWISGHMKNSRVKARNICFQVSEHDASQYQKQTVALSKALRSLGFRFAVEQFGIGRDPLRVLTNTPMDYVKFDGSFMQRIADDRAIQEKLRGFVSNATRHKIQTIASRVENANAMAVLFQLGVSYMQGHYLHEPEVVLEAAS